MRQMLTKNQAYNVITQIMEIEGFEPTAAVDAFTNRGYGVDNFQDLISIERDLNNAYNNIETFTKPLQLAPTNIVNMATWIQNNSERIPGHLVEHSFRFIKVA